MKRLLTIIMLLLTAQTLFASANDDLSKSKGTDQEVIVSLAPAPEQTDVPRTVKIEAVFSVPLDPLSVQKNNVKLTFLSSQTNEHIDGDLNYVEEENKVIYTPNSLLEPGMYEVEIKSLKPTKAYKTTTIKEIKYRFIVVPEVLENIVISPNAIEIKEGATVQLSAIGHYDNGNEKNLTTKVEWSVGDPALAFIDANGTLTALKEGMTTITASMNPIEGNASLTVYKEMYGHRLPPEPDPAINNSTLLGIDVNNNGVRDDVERWIYTRYDTYFPCKQVVVEIPGTDIKGTRDVCEETPVPYHRIVREIAMQGARAAQIVIQEPEKARETIKYMHAAQECNTYFRSRANTYNEPILLDHTVLVSEEFNEIQFNTVVRLRAYAEYNHALSGGVFESSSSEIMRSKCDFDVDGLLGK